MPKVSIHTLKGEALNWAIKQLPASNMTQGYDLLFESGVSIIHSKIEPDEPFWATRGDTRDEETLGVSGSTAMEAGLRCLVYDHFGDEMSVPQDVLESNERAPKKFCSVEQLREAGSAVVIFSASELSGADPKDVENRLVEFGNEIIEDLQPMRERRCDAQQ